MSADELVFGDAERGPNEELRLRFEGRQPLTPEERQVAKELLESLTLRHEARRWSAPPAPRKTG